MKKLVARVAALILGAIIAVGACEVFLRVFPGFLSEEAHLRVHWEELNRRARISVADPYLGFRYPANTSRELQRGDFRFTFTTDAHGFRNSGAWPDTADVVTVGDSQAFGYGVDDSEAWASIVAGALYPLRLVNLGLIGASPQQYLRIFKKYGADLRPRVLLFCLFPGNDVFDAAVFDAWLKAGGPGNYDVWRFFRGEVPESRGLSALFHRSYLVTYVNEIKKSRLSQSLLNPKYRGQTVDFPDGVRIRLAPGILARSSSGARPDHPYFQLVMDAIEETRQLAGEAGTRFVVVLFPSKEEVYLPALGKPCPDPIGAFTEVFDERGIEYLDLTPELQALAREGKKHYFEVDGHANAEGNAAIAEIVLRYLRENVARQSEDDT